ncbi:hypothetical protein OSTOST_20829 [Ostertagia ostertagi]
MNGTEATPSIRTLAALLILVPALCGLLLQLLLGIALYSGWKTFRGNTFYLITVQIMCCDVYALALDLYAAFPLTLTGIQYMGDSVTLYYLPLAFEGIAFNGIFMLSFLLTSNRFLLFIFPRVHRLVFTATGTKMQLSGICCHRMLITVQYFALFRLSLMVWAYVFTLITVSNVAGCRKEFSKEYFYFWYNCSYGSKAYHYKNFVYISSCVITSLMTLMYVIIYIKLKVGKQGLAVSFHGSVKQEVKYLVQVEI